MHLTPSNAVDCACNAIVPSPAGSTITLESPWGYSQAGLDFVLIGCATTPEALPDAARPLTIA